MRAWGWPRASGHPPEPRGSGWWPGEAGDALVRLHVPGPGGLDDLRRDGRSGWRLVPSGAGGPVPDELLVEWRLGAAGLVVRGGPETGRVRGQHLVREHERAV